MAETSSIAQVQGGIQNSSEEITKFLQMITEIRGKLEERIGSLENITEGTNQQDAQQAAMAFRHADSLLEQALGPLGTGIHLNDNIIQRL